jgi:hypothetical protein
VPLGSWLITSSFIDRFSTATKAGTVAHSRAQPKLAFDRVAGETSFRPIAACYGKENEGGSVSGGHVPAGDASAGVA